MKHPVSSGWCKGCLDDVAARSRRRRRRLILPISAGSRRDSACHRPHIPRARGGGRSLSLQFGDERGPTRREALSHLFGIVHAGTSQEIGIQRTPPFTPTGVDDGFAPRGTCGVVLRVVTSTNLRSTQNTSKTRRGLQPQLNRVKLSDFRFQSLEFRFSFQGPEPDVSPESAHSTPLADTARRAPASTPSRTTSGA
jgi:hypothetical protein